MRQLWHKRVATPSTISKFWQLVAYKKGQKYTKLKSTCQHSKYHNCTVHLLQTRRRVLHTSVLESGIKYKNRGNLWTCNSDMTDWNIQPINIDWHIGFCNRKTACMPEQHQHTTTFKEIDTLHIPADIHNFGISFFKAIWIIHLFFQSPWPPRFYLVQA